MQCSVKKKEETFSAHLSATLPHDKELQLSLSADIFNSIQDLAALPNSASLVGVLTQSKDLTEGKSKINVLMHLLSVQIHFSVKGSEINIVFSVLESSVSFREVDM